MVPQMWVYVSYEMRNLRAHAVLHGQCRVVQFILNKAFEKRQIQMVVNAKVVHGRRWPQLLMVADEDQMLASCVESCHYVSFQYLVQEKRTLVIGICSASFLLANRVLVVSIHRAKCLGKLKRGHRDTYRKLPDMYHMYSN